MPFTLGDLVPQIGQRNVWAKLRDQIFFPILSRAPATVAR
jgi:hypothetical protein